MNTILTNDERRAAIKSVRHGMFTDPVPDDVARAVEAAALAKLAQQEPVGTVESAVKGAGGFHVRLDAAEQPAPGTKLYTHPAPQQADAPEAPAPHPDDVAVDDFAQAMKYKLASARHKGREGWQTFPPEELSRMLREHVEKGDPLDVANFCMFLWWLGHGIAPAQSDVAEAVNETNAILAGRYFELLKVVEAYEKNGVTCQTFRHFVDAPCGECNVDAPSHGDFDDCDASPDGKHSESWYANNDCDYCKTGKRDAPEAPVSKCAQCKKEYKHSKSSSGCPKCAPGLSVTEDEFQKPIFTLSQKGEK